MIGVELLSGNGTKLRRTPVLMIRHRIDVSYRPWPDSVELNDYITFGPDEMSHPCRRESQRSSRHFTRARLIELLSHAQVEVPEMTGDVLYLRMGIGKG